jgi:hypothetical protein
MTTRTRRGRALACALVVLGLATPARAAKRIWEPGKASLAKGVRRTYSQPEVARALTDPVEHAAMTKMLAAAARSSGTRARRRLAHDLDNAIGRMLRFVEPSPAAAKQFVAEMDGLFDWAKRADELAGSTRHMDELGALVLRLSSHTRGDLGNWSGAWFELRLAAREARTPGRLERLQPSAPPRPGSSLPADTEDFRDFGLLIDPAVDHRAWLEAKNWQGKTVSGGTSTITSQVTSHFGRVDPHWVGPPQPPGLQLMFEFNSRMPRQWAEAIQDATAAALQAPPHGKSCADAWTWVAAFLVVSCTDLGRATYALPGGCDPPPAVRPKCPAIP